MLSLCYIYCYDKWEYTMDEQVTSQGLVYIELGLYGVEMYCVAGLCSIRL